MTKKILFLTLKCVPFDAIAEGWKKTEFRGYKLHWIERLMYADGTFKEYDEIHFRNGYHKTDPFMVVEWKGITLVGDVFHIQLGKVLRIENWGKGKTINDAMKELVTPSEKSKKLMQELGITPPKD